MTKFKVNDIVIISPSAVKKANLKPVSGVLKFPQGKPFRVRSIDFTSSARYRLSYDGLHSHITIPEKYLRSCRNVLAVGDTVIFKEKPLTLYLRGEITDYDSKGYYIVASKHKCHRIHSRNLTLV